MPKDSVKALEEFGSYIASSLPDGVRIKTQIAKDTLVINAPYEHIVHLLLFLRDDARCQYKILTDLCGVDYPEREKRFDVVYNLLSLKYNRRILVKVQADESTLVPSVVDIFSSANWFEREVWDMYGIYFSNHPDLRRILSDYGFDGHPQRKDFPLTGYVEVRYDENKKRVVYEPVKLEQEFRSFDFVSPWEGTEYKEVAGD